MAKQMKMINRARMENDQERLKQLTDEIQDEEDFQRFPWSFDVLLNRLYYEIFVYEDLDNIATKMEQIMESTDKHKINELSYGHFLILLSTVYQRQHRETDSKCLIDEVMAIVYKKRNISRYLQLLVAAYINQMTYELLVHGYDRVLHIGNELYKIQMRESYYEQLNHTVFYMACAHYQLGHSEEAADWFTQTLYISIIRYKPMDYYYFSKSPVFHDLFRHDNISETLKKKFQSLYHIKIIK